MLRLISPYCPSYSRHSALLTFQCGRASTPPCCVFSGTQWSAGAVPRYNTFVAYIWRDWCQFDCWSCCYSARPPLPFNYYSYLATSWSSSCLSVHIRSFLSQQCLAAPQRPIPSTNVFSSIAGGWSPSLWCNAQWIVSLSNRVKSVDRCRVRSCSRMNWMPIGLTWCSLGSCDPMV